MNFAELTTIDEIRRVLRGENVFAVTDENVYSLYGDLFTENVAVMKAGEKYKNAQTVCEIIAQMVEKGFDRKATVVAVGGGVVGDVAGFAAATYKRGVKWINVPTTLLAMVDSGVGGKTGVDVEGYKNVFGAFHLPQRVLIAPEFLRTLPKREVTCGEGEIIKHALLCPQVKKALGASREELIMKNVRFKESVVAEDFTESGRRKILNAGHTVGHALETLDRFALSHGEYVAVGLATELTMFREELNEAFCGEGVALARGVCSAHPNFTAEEICRVAQADKKNVGGKISIMLPTGEGAKEYLLTPEEFIRRLKCSYPL